MIEATPRIAIGPIVIAAFSFGWTHHSDPFADIAMLDPEVLQAAAAGADIRVVYEVMQTAPDGIAIAGESAIADVAELEGETGPREAGHQWRWSSKPRSSARGASAPCA